MSNTAIPFATPNPDHFDWQRRGRPRAIRGDHEQGYHRRDTDGAGLRLEFGERRWTGTDRFAF